MIDYAAYIAIKLFNKIFALIPITISLWIARRLGAIAFFFNKKRRLVAYANLKSAFSKEKSPKELRAITKDVYRNLLQTFIEVLNLTKVNKEYVDRYIDVVNMERIDEASISGRGVILLTGHFGCWEMSSIVSAVIGYPITVLAREQKLKRVNELLNRLRESKGCKVVRKGMATKNVIKALYEKDIVGILSDQDAGKGGVFVDFFDRPTSCHAGPMEIAQRTDSIILPNFIVRVKGPRHKIFLEEYIDFRKSAGGDDVKEGLQGFATLLESYIRRYPDQWLWLHKRWKSTPIRTVLVLNDGRIGHLNQSLAVARQIQKARTTQGYKSDDTKIVTVDVKFKNPFLRSALSSCAIFASWRCHGCMRCMKFCLEKETYETLMTAYSEFVISCGSSLASVNIYMSKENNAKNIVIMKPNILMGLKEFSLAVIPRHDRPPRVKNVVATTIAPNLMDPDRLKADGERLKSRIRLEKKMVLGLLVGGDNPEYSLTGEIVDNVIDNLLKFCDRADAEFLITTSRRTDNRAETILKNRLKDNPRCKLLVIANQNNMDEAVGGILYLSDVIVVSGESISMISEAISSGKRTVAFELEKKRNVLTKHSLALTQLEKDGYISLSRPEDLASTIERACDEEKVVTRDLDDNEKIFTAVRRLI